MESGTNEQECALEIALHAVPSTLQASGEGEIPFERAVLSIRNAGNSTAAGFVPHATLTQEGGPVHDGTEALSQMQHVDSIPPGEAITWDVYDLLRAANAGLASKVHLFGYKAILNWWFELVVWVEYHIPDDAPPRHSPTSRWKFLWNPARPPHDAITLSIEAINDNQ